MKKNSDSEEKIREDVEKWIRENRPEARIIHEIVAGDCRVDVMSVDMEEIIIFEIKSEKDVLTRLKKQYEVFKEYAHQAVLVASKCWFETISHTGDDEFLDWAHPDQWGHPLHVWCHPSTKSRSTRFRWELQEIHRRLPHPWFLLDLLWREELMREANEAQLKVRKQAPRREIIEAMVLGMTGREINRTVCRCLRKRKIIRGDAPRD